MVGELSPLHWLVVIGVFMVLFGAQRLPDAARSLGRSARILKAELGADDTAPAATPVPAPEVPQMYTAPAVVGPPAAAAPTPVPPPA